MPENHTEEYPGKFKIDGMNQGFRWVHFTKNQRSRISCYCLFNVASLKGIVQRDLTGVENRIKRSALINYLVALVLFLNLKGHSCERSKKPVSAS
jgi:hypothetical protein